MSHSSCFSYFLELIVFVIVSKVLKLWLVRFQNILLQHSELCLEVNYLSETHYIYLTFTSEGFRLLPLDDVTWQERLEKAIENFKMGWVNIHQEPVGWTTANPMWYSRQVIEKKPARFIREAWPALYRSINTIHRTTTYRLLESNCEHAVTRVIVDLVPEDAAVYAPLFKYNGLYYVLWGLIKGAHSPTDILRTCSYNSLCENVNIFSRQKLILHFQFRASCTIFQKNISCCFCGVHGALVIL